MPTKKSSKKTARKKKPNVITRLKNYFQRLLEEDEKLPEGEELKRIAGSPDIMMTDTDQIRTNSREYQDHPPVFPSQEEIRNKLLRAEKYFKEKRNVHPSTSLINEPGEELVFEEGDEDGVRQRPPWLYILERPPVEQYVLMRQYIRRLSALAELEEETDTHSIEEDVSDPEGIFEQTKKRDKVPKGSVVSKRSVSMKITKKSQPPSNPETETTATPQNIATDEGIPPQVLSHSPSNNDEPDSGRQTPKQSDILLKSSEKLVVSDQSGEEDSYFHEVDTGSESPFRKVRFSVKPQVAASQFNLPSHLTFVTSSGGLRRVYEPRRSTESEKTSKTTHATKDKIEDEKNLITDISCARDKVKIKTKAEVEAATPFERNPTDFLSFRKIPLPESLHDDQRESSDAQRIQSWAQTNPMLDSTYVSDTVVTHRKITPSYTRKTKCSQKYVRPVRVTPCETYTENILFEESVEFATRNDHQFESTAAASIECDSIRNCAQAWAPNLLRDPSEDRIPFSTSTDTVIGVEHHPRWLVEIIPNVKESKPPTNATIVPEDRARPEQESIELDPSHFDPANTSSTDFKKTGGPIFRTTSKLNRLKKSQNKK